MLNNILPIAKAKIPILAIRSGQDQSVLLESNIDVLEKKLKDAGGNITVLREITMDIIRMEWMIRHRLQISF